MRRKKITSTSENHQPKQETNRFFPLPLSCILLNAGISLSFLYLAIRQICIRALRMPTGSHVRTLGGIFKRESNCLQQHPDELEWPSRKYILQRWKSLACDWGSGWLQNENPTIKTINVRQPTYLKESLIVIDEVWVTRKILVKYILLGCSMFFLSLQW